MHATAIATWQAHGPYDHGGGWQSQLHLYHRHRQSEQVITPQKRRPIGSVPAPLLFNISISDLPSTVSWECAYADNLAIIHVDGHWQAVEGVLSKYMATVGEQRHGKVQTWKLKFSTTKTVSALSISITRKSIVSWKSTTPKKPRPSAPNPNACSNVGQEAQLGVTLDRSITYCRHLELLCRKLTSRVGVLLGYDWCAGTTTLWTVTLALVHSAAEYCDPVWCRSAHTRLIDPAIIDTLRIVTECLRPGGTWLCASASVLVGLVFNFRPGFAKTL